MTYLTRLAIIPGLIIIVYIYGKDKVEKEPISLIMRLIIFGALSGFVAGYMESVVMTILPEYPEGSLAYAASTAFLVAGVCEELVKYLALLVGSWNHPSFNYRFDGIVYGVSAAIGFEVLENINYVYMYGAGVALTRAFTAVPLHAFCGAVMGIMYSYAKKASIDGRQAASTGYSLAAYLVPLLIHGLYDTFAMYKSPVSVMLLYALLAYLYITVTKMVNRFSAADRNGNFYSGTEV